MPPFTCTLDLRPSLYPRGLQTAAPHSARLQQSALEPPLIPSPPPRPLPPRLMLALLYTTSLFVRLTSFRSHLFQAHPCACHVAVSCKFSILLCLLSGIFVFMYFFIYYGYTHLYVLLLFILVLYCLSYVLIISICCYYLFIHLFIFINVKLLITPLYLPSYFAMQVAAHTRTQTQNWLIPYATFSPPPSPVFCQFFFLISTVCPACLIVLPRYASLPSPGPLTIHKYFFLRPFFYRLLQVFPFFPSLSAPSPILAQTFAHFFISLFLHVSPSFQLQVSS